MTDQNKKPQSVQRVCRNCTQSLEEGGDPEKLYCGKFESQMWMEYVEESGTCEHFDGGEE